MDDYGPRIDVNNQEGVTTIHLLDEELLEEYAINEMAEAVFLVLDDYTPIKLALSFDRVKHLSSSALGTLIRLSKKIAETEGGLKLCDIKANLYEIFVITKLNKHFDICPTLQDATNAFRK